MCVCARAHACVFDLSAGAVEYELRYWPWLVTLNTRGLDLGG